MLAEYDENGSLTTYYTRGAELISQERNGVKSYYVYDGHDSVRMLTDEDGTVTNLYTYDAFGNLTEKLGDTENSYLYCGEQFDAFTGLYYLRARYMNPSTGTFITMDEYAGSAFEPVSLHKYLYANANPVMYCDPTGYSTAGSLLVGSTCMSQVGAAYVAAGLAVAFTALKIYNTLIDIAFNIILQMSIIELQLTVLTTSDANYAVATMDMVVENMISSLQAIVNKKINLKLNNSYTVYTLVDGSDNTVRYVGRTKNYEKRMMEHAKKGGKNAKLKRGDKIDHLTYAQSRALEQTLMVYYHTRNWLDENGNNDINGISPKNKKKRHTLMR